VTAAKSRAVRRLEQVDWDFPGHNPRTGTQGIHALHWYPAPFPAALPATLLDILSPTPGRFLDPFCGSGVAVLESWMRGHKASGIDINRFAAELVTVKAGMLAAATEDRGRLLAAEYAARAATARLDFDGTTTADVCAAAGMRVEAAEWFAHDVLVDLAVARAWAADRAGEERDWLRVLLSSLLHRASILRDVHYTYVVDRSRTKEPPTSTVDVPGAFAAKIRRAYADANSGRSELQQAGADLADAPRPTVLAGPAQKAGTLVDGLFDIVVTSPPYFGMNDYVRSQYLSWLVTPWDGYDDDRAAESGPRRDRRRTTALDAYNDDMDAAFRETASLLRPDGYLAVVIGASQSPVARDRDPVASLRARLDALPLRPVWEGSRRVRNRKINNAPNCVEAIWVYQA
jgi:SAM-dependent methyltransferase